MSTQERKRASMKGALTAGEFARGVKKFPRMSEKAQEIAKEILVEGHAPSAVADRHGVTRQNCHFWSKQIYDAVVPDGWVSEVITLPRVKMEEVRALVVKERTKWRQDSRH